MSYNILDLIKSDETDLADKNGEKPLLRVAQRIRMENSKETIENILEQLEKIDFLELSLPQLNSFLSFVFYSALFNEIIYNKLTSELKHRLIENDHNIIVKRSLVLRFLANNYKNRISLQDMLNEESVRAEVPWVWCDIISIYNWSLAEEEIGKLISKGDGLDNLVIRLPHLIKKIDKETLKNSFIKWYSNALNKNQQKILQKWATSLNIKFGLSISAEHSLNNIPLFQQSII